MKKQINNQWVQENQERLAQLPLDQQFQFWNNVLEYEGLAPIGEDTKFEEDFDLVIEEMHEVVNAHFEAFEASVNRLFRKWKREEMEEVRIQATYEYEFLGLPF